MKTQILKISTTIIAIMTLFISCSSNENPSDVGESSSKQFIKTIQEQNPESWQKGSQFFYDNDRLTYVYLSDCSGELYYFEYNNDGKISKSYSQGYYSFDADNFNPETFDITAFKQNKTPLNYVYQAGKLVKMQYDNNFIDYQFTYNSDGSLQVAEWFIPQIGLWEKVVLTYSNGKISNLNKKEYDTDGSLHDNYNYTFEYDNKQNPFYNLADSFSLLGIYTCTGFDYISSEDMGLKLFINNVTKVYRDGVELFSATYQYDDNNYPTRMSYTDLNGNYSGVDLITYAE